MDYQQFVQAVRQFDFIPDDQTADAAVKAVLGIFASQLKDADAHRFTEHLPEPLTYDRLHSHQARRTVISTDEYFEELAAQFKISTEQAARLVQEVFHTTKQNFSEDELRQLVPYLPEEWNSLIEAS